MVLVAGTAGVVVALNRLSPPPPAAQQCVAELDGTRWRLSPDQAQNAALIAATGVQRGLPARAVTIALATALQESKLENIEHGDRDSLGLFQQRPSQGWGTAEQVRDPRYAAGKFYSALKKVKGYPDMRVTDAAQRVQRSAYPEAYQKWADESAVLAKALMGRATGAVECTVSGDPALRGAAAAAALMEGLRLDWGKGLAKAGEQVAGLTVKVKDAKSGWRYAHWLVAHATGTGLERVRFADLEWSAPDGKWQQVTADRAAGGGTVVAEVFS